MSAEPESDQETLSFGDEELTYDDILHLGLRDSEVCPQTAWLHYHCQPLTGVHPFSRFKWQLPDYACGASGNVHLS